MFGRPLLALGIALLVSSCSKAESKKSEPPPESVETRHEPTPEVEGAPHVSAEEPSIKPVAVEMKGSGVRKEVADPKQPTKEEPKPEPAPGGESDSSFAMTVEPPAAVAPGGEVVLRVRVTPGSGYKMNAEFPTKLTFEPTAGIKLDKTALALSDAEKFDEHQLVFAVKATPEAAGSYTVTGKIKFAVCTDATCDPKKRNVSFTVAAK